MFNRQKRLYLAALILVSFICMGAMILAVRAMIENLHFISATNNLSAIVVTVRLYVKEQKTRSFSAEEDILSKMIEVKQLPSAFATNPWGGGLRVLAVDNQSMRIETDVPEHACRRMALYLLGRRPAELGLLSVEARVGQLDEAVSIYPKPDAEVEAEAIVQKACGNKGAAQLALVFKIRE